MEPVTFDEIQEFFTQSNIEVADPKPGIGREITYAEPPLRTVIFHIAESDPVEYISTAVSLILETQEWLLVPRFGSATDLHLIESTGDLAAILFKTSDHASLAAYLSTRPTSPGCFSADLYVISRSGTTLITWDHHTSEEGLSIQFQKVKDSSRVLNRLNELGAELEVFSSHSQEDNSDDAHIRSSL